MSCPAYACNWTLKNKTPAKHRSLNNPENRFGCGDILFNLPLEFVNRIKLLFLAQKSDQFHGYLFIIDIFFKIHNVDFYAKSFAFYGWIQSDIGRPLVTLSAHVYEHRINPNAGYEFVGIGQSNIGGGKSKAAADLLAM